MREGDERSGQGPIRAGAPPGGFAFLPGARQPDLEQAGFDGVARAEVFQQVLGVFDILARGVQRDGTFAAKAHGHGQHEGQIFLAGGDVYSQLLGSGAHAGHDAVGADGDAQAELVQDVHDIVQVLHVLRPLAVQGHLAVDEIRHDQQVQAHERVRGDDHGREVEVQGAGRDGDGQPVVLQLGDELLQEPDALAQQLAGREGLVQSDGQA